MMRSTTKEHSMTGTVAINVILDLAVLVAVVGGLAWAVWSDRRQRELTDPVRQTLPKLRQRADTHQLRSKHGATAPPVNPAHARP
jgi:hypothetical protein